MTLQRLTPGEEFVPRADTWNAFADAAEAVLGRHERRNHTPAPPLDPLRRGLMLVKNTTAAAWGRFEPKGIAGTLWHIAHLDGGPDVPAIIDGGGTSIKVGDISGRQVLLGEDLDHEKHQGNWCVTIEPIAAGGIGWACVAGLCLCRVVTYLGGYENQPIGRSLRYAALMRVGGASVIGLSDVGDAAVLYRTEGPGSANYADCSIALIDLGARRETALAHLTAAIQYPNAENGADAPFSTQARLLLRDAANGYQVIDAATRIVTVWFPGWRRSAGQYVGLPPATVGDRVPVRFNAQAARWEAIVATPDWCRFVLTASLARGGSAQAKTIVYLQDGTRVTDEPPAETITVHDVHGLFSKPATAAGDDGALGVAVFAADKARWEIISMQTPGDFIGALTQDCHQWDSPVVVTKVAMLGGYDIFGPNHGNEISVANPTGGGNQGQYWFSGRQGDRVICRWNMQQGQYYIAAVEPNDFGWQPLDVVTRTTLAINFGAQTFTHRYYTRQITVPPWVTIGQEVQH